VRITRGHGHAGFVAFKSFPEHGFGSHKLRQSMVAKDTSVGNNLTGSTEGWARALRTQSLRVHKAVLRVDGLLDSIEPMGA
jgi:hypothetical protein